jgi:hypothetical protein
MLKEHEQLWLQLRHMYGYLLKVYAFYVAALGATVAVTITLLSENAKRTEVKALLTSPEHLPGFFVVPSLVLLVALGATLLLHIMKFRNVSTEYAEALNAIRRGFYEHDVAVQPYLALPRGGFPGSKWWNVDAISFGSVAFFSGILAGCLVLFAMIRLAESPAFQCGALAGVVVFIGWCIGWAVLWGMLVPPHRHPIGRSDTEKC